MLKIAGIGNGGAEDFVRLRMMLESRAEVGATGKVLMGEDRIKEMKDADRAQIERLFLTAPANITQAPNLTKESKAKNVKAFFEKLSASIYSTAQTRYPELLKVSSTSMPDSADSSISTTSLKPRNPTAPTGKIATRSSLSGGAP